MDPNPYESPKVGEVVREKGVVPGDPLLAILSEIRDGQAELLELHRQSVAMQRELANRARVFRPYTVLIMLLPLVFVAFPLYRLWTMKAPTIPVRAPRVPRVPAPVVPPGAVGGPVGS